MNIAQLFIIFALGVTIAIFPVPDGLTEGTWRLFAVFVATIVGVILQPLPMGCIALLSLTCLVVTKTLPFEAAFSGFSSESAWLIVLAYFIARGFIKTGLGQRISYLFMSLLGGHPIGLGFGILATDLVLAPAIPSNTARTGGVVLPILESLAEIFHSKPKDPSSKRIGAYLTQVAIQGSCITSAMFLTSMSANPLIADLSRDFGVEITWSGWAIAAAVPGLISLAVCPFLMYLLTPPEIQDSKNAPALAKEKLKAIGRMKKEEWTMLGVFVSTIILWAFAKEIGIKPAASALTGVALLLLTRVITWDDVKKESSAWETLVWFATILMLASQLSKQGFTEWMGEKLSHLVIGYDWKMGFLFLSLSYFYTHYFFASNLAHVTALYATFLSIALTIGTPPLFAALVLGFFSSLFGALTHYTSGPAALLFGAGFVDVKAWWRAGLIASVVNLAIWMGLGAIWWGILGIL